MQRRLFLLGICAFPLTPKRDLRKIITEISASDKAYNTKQEAIVKRAKYFNPESDPAIKGYARQESEISHKIGDLWQEFAEL